MFGQLIQPKPGNRLSNDHRRQRRMTPSYDVVPAAGFGDLHLQGSGYEVSFDYEDPGWYVGFDGDISSVNTDEFIGRVAGQIQEDTGISTEWVRVA